jgi:outer membrane autotransporter protein
MTRAAAFLGLATALFAASAFAECGGTVQCIGVGTTVAEAQANHHPAPDLGSANITLAFGSRSTGTMSASQTVFVEAVTGPAGSMAVLGPITLGGANAAEFSITGGTCSATNGPVHGGPGCTVTVAFSPLSAGAKSALLNVPVDPPSCVGCIAGRAVALTGSATGPTVSAPRADPSRDANVVAALRAQGLTGLRFSRAQMANFHERMESLRGVAPSSMLGAASAGASRALADESGTSVWLAGGVNFGRQGGSEMADLRFSTSGVSLGADRRFGERLVMGVGLGFARDDTDIGTDGSSNKGSSQSIAFYASYRPAARLFIDGVVAYGRLEQDTRRFVASANDFAAVQRDGRYAFGSFSAGYDYRRDALLLSPYARLSFTQVQLEQATESGAGSSALTLFEQKLKSTQAALGTRAQSLHETSFGWAQPRARVEFVHDSTSDPGANVAFADQAGGPIFAIASLDTKRNSVFIGIGADFLLRHGLKISFEYLQQRLPGPDSNQAIRLLFSKDLDGRTPNPGRAYSGTFANPVNVEATWSYDDNLNRAPESGPNLSDHFYSLNVGTGIAIPLAAHARMVLNAFLEGDKFRFYEALDRFSGGAQGELQYRTSASFGAPTFGLFARGTADQYSSELRSGHRLAVGVSWRQPLTDRLELFGTLTRNSRDAEHPVFETRDNAARLSVDYSLGRGTLYGAGEYRRGDAVSSVRPGFETAVVSKAAVRDDAYFDYALFAHRYAAKTWLATLGYNWPLGSRDSLDFSARRAHSTPTNMLDAGGGPYAGGPPSYTANQFSAAYLMRF